MASRKILDLIPEMQEKFKEFSDAMLKAGIDFIVTCTYRAQEEQNELYKQGRTKPGKIVTHTLHSKHTQRKAFDIAILKRGKITWEEAEYDEAGKVGKAVGLKWGGAFGDRPHFEWKETK
jgi:peptidoglycan L-alanyl-D-glutamate endopeptidase CwlK